MNEERLIEKLLRRYAKKRRDEAGAPVELHPATRRMLQGSVARHFPKRAAGGDGEATTLAQILSGWRARWLWALPVLIVLGVGVWVLIGPGEKPAFEFDLAKNTSAPTVPAGVLERSFKSPEAAQSALPAPGLSLADQAAPVYANAIPARDGWASGGAPAGAGAAPRRASVEEPFAFRDAKTQAKDAAFSSPPKNDSLEDFDGFRKDYVSEGKDKLAIAPASKPAEAAPAASARFYQQEVPGVSGRDKLDASSQAFVNRAPASSHGKTAAPGDIAPVLMNFQVEQTGNQLRVIDDDGSTYLGKMNLADAGQGTAAALEKSGSLRLALKQENKRAAGQPGAVLLAEQQGAQKFVCRVEGTNRTLNQQVVFSWNFVALTNELAAAQVKLPARAANVLPNNLPAQPFPLLLNNSVINGRAQLGGAKEIIINAVPVSP